MVHLHDVGVGGSGRDVAEFAVGEGPQLSHGADLHAVVALVEPHPCSALQRDLHTVDYGSSALSVGNNNNNNR